MSQPPMSQPPRNQPPRNQPPGPSPADLRVWMLELLCAPASFPVLAWAEGSGVPDPAGPGAPPLPERVGAVVEALPGVQPAVLERFRDAVLAGEPVALRAWAAMTASVAEILPRADVEMRRQLADGDIAGALRDGPVVAALATVTGQAETAVAARIVTARAAFALDDLDSTIAQYRLATEVQGASPALRCIVEDNLGLALCRRGRDEDLDEAVAHFSSALRLAETPAERTAVRANRAEALEALGQLDLAVAERTAVVDAYRAHGGEPSRVAAALDNLAVALRSAGDLGAAHDRLVEAARVFPAGDLVNRCINAVARQDVLQELGRAEDATGAFKEAWDLGRRAAEASVDVGQLRAGLAQALSECPRPAPQAEAWLMAGLQARAQEDSEQAKVAFAQAAQLAGASGDHVTRLRAAANAAAVLADFGEARQAAALCRQVRSEAVRRGLAGPAAMVTGTLATLQGAGVGADSVPTVLLLAQAEHLTRVNEALVTESGLAEDHPERFAATHPTGKLELEMFFLARDAGADGLAEQYLRRSLAALDGVDAPFERLNRTAALLDLVRRRTDGREEAAQLAAGIEQMLTDEDAPAQGALVGHRALAAYLGMDDPRAVDHLQAAAGALEGLRTAQPDPDRREGLERSHKVVPTLVTALLANGRPGEELLTALQRGRARRLLDLLGDPAATPVPAVPPPDGAGVRRLLADLTEESGVEQALVEVTAVADGLLALVVTAADVRVVHVRGDLDELGRALWGDAERRAVDAVTEVVRSRMLADLVTGVEAALPPGTPVLVVTDNALANLPLHLVPVDGVAWGRRRTYGRIAAAAVLGRAPADRGWRGASLVAGDSDGSLPGAAAECAAVADLLGTTALVGAGCSLDAIAARLHDDLDVVHLAVHGRSDVRRGGRGSLLLADPAQGPARWVPFDALARLPWRAQLIVLSGCSTAVGGPRDGVGLYGVAQAAAEAGATTVLASLWPVEDEAARRLMIALHTELARRRAAGEESVDLRVVLRDAAGATSVPAPGAAGAPVAAGGPSDPVRSGREFGLPGLTPPALPAIGPEVRAALRDGAFLVLGTPMLRLSPR